MSSEPPILPGCTVLPPLLTPEEKRRKAERAERREAEAAKPGKGKAKARDRFAVLNAFADYGARLVNPTAQACWWIVFREVKPDGLARVSHGQIAERVGVSRRTAIRAMRELEHAGLLLVVRRGGLRVGTSTYRVRGTPRRA